MREYTHIAGAILFYLILVYLLNLHDIIIGIIFAGWISVFPDILDKLIGKHRSIGHSILWILPLILVGYFNIYLGIALLTGFLSHLFLDIFTRNGCPLLYPILRTNFVALKKQFRIKTQTSQEKAVFIFLIFLIIPVFMITTGIYSIAHLPGYQNLQSNSESDNLNLEDNYKNNLEPKNTIYINLDLKSKTNKNITIQKINENITNIIIKNF